MRIVWPPCPLLRTASQSSDLREEEEKGLDEEMEEMVGQGTLEGPLDKMTKAMTETSKGNGDAVSGMLETMLTGFMAKLEDTFGGQIRGIHEQMDKSSGVMSTVQAALVKLVDDINTSNGREHDNSKPLDAFVLHN